VGGVVADQPERVIAALGGDDLDLRPVLDRRRQVAQLAVDPDAERRARQALADRAGDVEASGALGDVESRLVGELNRHGVEPTRVVEV
jgi:hypothetical protein